MTIFRSNALALTLAVIAGSTSIAGEADVVDARVTRQATGTYMFEVTVRHADTGWDHYANAFEVIDPDGNVLGVRELLHPHVNEQPFTRSLSGVEIPDGTEEVIVRARDSVHDYGGAEIKLPLPE